MKNKLPEPVDISSTLKATPRRSHFDDRELWWDLWVMGPRGWFNANGGPADSTLWWDIGVTLQAR
jgi:hypothetical protein